MPWGRWPHPPLWPWTVGPRAGWGPPRHSRNMGGQHHRRVAGRHGPARTLQVRLLQIPHFFLSTLVTEKWVSTIWQATNVFCDYGGLLWYIQCPKSPFWASKSIPNSEPKVWCNAELFLAVCLFSWTEGVFGCDAVYVRPSGFYSTNYGYPILVVTNLGLMLGSYGLVFWQMNRYCLCKGSLVLEGFLWATF